MRNHIVPVMPPYGFGHCCTSRLLGMHEDSWASYGTCTICDGERKHMAGYLYAVSTYPIVGSKNADGRSEKFSVRSASKRQAAMVRSDVPRSVDTSRGAQCSAWRCYMERR